MFKGPGETVAEDPGETVFKGPEETVAEGPGETVFEGPEETVAEGPGETVAEGPGETVFSGPGETVAEGPGETVFKGPGETVAERPGETVLRDSRRTSRRDSTSIDIKSFFISNMKVFLLLSRKFIHTLFSLSLFCTNWGGMSLDDYVDGSVRESQLSATHALPLRLCSDSRRSQS